MESLKEYNKTVITRLLLTLFLVCLGTFGVVMFPTILIILITLIFVRYVYVIFNPIKYPHPAIVAQSVANRTEEGRNTRTISEVFAPILYLPTASNPTTYATAISFGADDAKSCKTMNKLTKIDEVIYDIMIWNKTGDKRTRGQKAGSWALTIFGTIFGVIGLLMVIVMIMFFIGR